MACICTRHCCLQGTVASVQQDMQQRLEEALAENKAQAESLREARERNMHFSARVVALNSRVAQLTKQVCPSPLLQAIVIESGAFSCCCGQEGINSCFVLKSPTLWRAGLHPILCCCVMHDWACQSDPDINSLSPQLNSVQLTSTQLNSPQVTSEEY